ASITTAFIHAAMRWIELEPFLIAFWRNALCLALILPMVAIKLAWRAGPGALSRHAYRGVANTAAMVMLIMGLDRLPFAEATALTFATPAFMLFGSVIFLGERPRLVRWLSAVLGLLGVLIIAPPGPGWLGSGGMLILISAALFAASFLIGKTQTWVAGDLSILFYLYLALTILCTPLAASVWHWPDRAAFAGLGLVAVLSIAAHYSGIVALRRADASLVGLFDYLRLIWAAVIGVTIFDETPDRATIVGSATIVIAAVLPLLFDKASARRASS
ncbi:MAG: DMT family transporter, partial [Alphaproteobacteria bacterium]|nr:DMT family transporter [Alphaproteobacteria bacterium]